MRSNVNLFLLILLFSITISNGQSTLNWQKTLGGTGHDDFSSIVATPDGGYIAVGNHSDVIDGDITVGHGDDDAWVVKLDADGNLVWEKSFGGALEDNASDIIASGDGNYFVVGTAGDNTGDIIGNHGGEDLWLLKMDDEGNILWQKCYGGTSDDEGTTIIAAPGGNFLVLGMAKSIDGDVLMKHGTNEYQDYWAIKIEPDGDIMWNRCYGGTKQESPADIIPATTGGYYANGITMSLGGQGECNIDKWGGSMWLVKISELGVYNWSECYGTGTMGADSYQLEGPGGIITTSDAGFAAAAWIDDYDGFADDYPSVHSSGDYTLLKFNSAGMLEWSSGYGGNHYRARDLVQTDDGGYLVVGNSDADDEGDATGIFGAEDFWVTKFSSDGLLEWQQCFGGTNDDEAYKIIENGDGSFMIGGKTKSNDGLVTGAHGENHYDWWIIKITPDGNTIYTENPVEGNEFCFGETITVPYTVTSPFIAGNIFTAELSDEDGLFTSPTNIGSITSTTSGNISATIPLTGEETGDNYLIRVTSTLPPAIGSNTTDLIIGCRVPENLGKNSLTATSVHVFWDAVDCAESYTVQYKLATDVSWTSLTAASNSKNITGLIPASNYNWRVGTECDGGNSSKYTKKKNFTTHTLREGNINSEDITLYPNPAAGEINLSTTFENGVYSIRNLQGAELLNGGCSTQESRINISTLPAGLYFIQISNGYDQVVLKFEVM